jgi:uncharacterized delta-60 repeat protein
MKRLLAGRLIRARAGRPRAAAATLLALLLSLTPAVRARAAADLDPTFGPGGTLTTDFGGQEIGQAVAAQPDGKLVVAGFAGPPPSSPSISDMLVVRYNADGALDSSFGSGGKVLIDFGGTSDIASAVALQPDGKIVVAGVTSDGTPNLALARLNPDGALDGAFGSGGKLKTLLAPSFFAWPNAVLVQPDNRIVAAGAVRPSLHPDSTASDFFAARFNADGSTDPTFGSGGRTSLDVGNFDGAFGAALQPDGKIVLAGSASVSPASSFALVRLKADGTPDTTFDGDGRVITSFSGIAFAMGVMVQADGKLVAAGGALGGLSPNPDFALARYNADGSLDATFGAGGRVVIDFDNGRDTAFGVAAAPGGRILVGGHTNPNVAGAKPVFAAARLNADGSPDNTYGVGGRAVARFPSYHGVIAHGLTATPDSKLVVVGEAHRELTGDRDIAVARFAAPAGAEPASFARFSAQTYGAAEGCTAALVTVLREGDLSAPATVEYRTRDGSAKQRSDYTHTTGTLLFAAGESSKSFAVPVNDDAFAEGPEAIWVELVSASANVNFRVPAAATLTVADDDTGQGGANPLDNSQAFVCQHYHDFLSRQPDAAGLQFWTQGIEQCGADAQCREVKRVEVSQAFFLSIEFQGTGYFVIRAHKAAFGNQKGTPRYLQFLRDTQRVGRDVVVGQQGWEALLEANKQAFLSALVARPEFVAAHQEQTAGEYVDSLFANAGVTPTPGERQAAVAAFGAGGDEGRAAALRSVVESDSVYRRLYNAGFVLSQYFGYLRRNPDETPDFNFDGYDFWLSKLDSFSRPDEDVRDERVALARVRRAEMVKAFVTSLEYRRRFGQP